MAATRGAAQNPLDGSKPQEGGDKVANTPLVTFARELDMLRAGTSFRQLAPRAHMSYTALARAARGVEAPSWTVTVAFLAACGVTDESEKEKWKRKLEKARLWQTGNRLQKQDIASARRRRAQRKAAGTAGALPDPACIVTAAHLAEELRRLKLAAGNPSYRRIARASNQPRSTIGDMISGRRFPRIDVYEEVVAFLLSRVKFGAEWQTRANSWSIAYWRVAERRYVLGSRGDGPRLGSSESTRRLVRKS